MADVRGLDELRGAVVDAQAALQAAVLRMCPEHEPRQHRDRKPPWCKRCGCDSSGVQQRTRESPIGRGRSRQ